MVWRRKDGARAVTNTSVGIASRENTDFTLAVVSFTLAPQYFSAFWRVGSSMMWYRRVDDGGGAVVHQDYDSVGIAIGADVDQFLEIEHFTISGDRVILFWSHAQGSVISGEFGMHSRYGVGVSDVRDPSEYFLLVTTDQTSIEDQSAAFLGDDIDE